MINDFNPLDLSAPPKKLEEPVAPQPELRPKPTVNRVSMGPIFHSRITRVIALVLSVALATLVGYIAMTFYLSRTSSVIMVISVFLERG